MDTQRVNSGPIRKNSMVIGIDISQMVYNGTGVARYVEELTRQIVTKKSPHTFVLFGVSLRKRDVFSLFYESFPSEVQKKIKLKTIPFPIKLMEFIWNTLHIVPVEWIIGNVDIFWSSDWIQPPLAHATGVTTIHDVSIYRYPQSFDQKIVAVHTRKLRLSKQECSFFFCDSKATKSDVHALLDIPLEKLSVVYPGYLK